MPPSRPLLFAALLAPLATGCGSAVPDVASGPADPTCIVQDDGDLPLVTAEGYVSSITGEVQSSDVELPEGGIEEGEDLLACVQMPEGAPTCSADPDDWAHAWVSLTDAVCASWSDDRAWCYELEPTPVCDAEELAGHCCWTIRFE